MEETHAELIPKPSFTDKNPDKSEKEGGLLIGKISIIRRAHSEVSKPLPSQQGAAFSAT